MTPERWQRIDEIFTRAVALEGDARAALVAEACADDSELRRELEDLLATDRDQATLSRLHEVVEGTARERAESLRRIGPWTITGVVGDGGMGTVYRAQRDDDRFRKQVAIKILRQGLESEFALARFRYERQILGGLEHPNIARLIDAGEVEGRPYIVMEFVEGLQLTDYCREQGLGLEERIRLFRQVCEAVRYAHQRLVIHRDLKPSNILVSADGNVKLLDFGIAKLEDPDVRPEAAAETSTGMRLMTPGYASPEQVKGETVSAASDVYSLGAVLFELLTGEKAHRLTRLDPAELVRVVCQEEVALPSSVAPVEWRRTLRGDLDNIVGRALQKDPERRYQSVEQFSDDLRLYLEGRPVSARADTAVYRATKFLKRNRWATAMVTLLVVSLVGGAGISIYQARRAERRFEQVRGLARVFLFDINDEIENLPGAIRVRQMLVSTALTYLNSLAAEAAGDRGLSLEVAAAWQKVGDVLGNQSRASLGRTREAEESYAKSLLLAERVAAGTQDGQAWRLVAWAHIKLGGVRDDAIAELRKGVEIADRIARWEGRPDPALLMEAHRGLGDASYRTLGWSAALPEFDACLQAGQSTNRGDARLEETRMRCLQRAAKAQAALGDLDGAMARLLEARDALRDKVRSQPRHLEHQRNLLNVLIECGRWGGNPVNPSLGNPRAAIGYLLEALDLARGLRAEDPSDAPSRRGELAVLIGLAQTGALVDPARAEGWLREAETRNQELPEGSAKSFYRQFLAEAKGRLLEKLGRYRESRTELERAIRLAQQQTGRQKVDQRSDALASRMAIAHVSWQAGASGEAFTLYQKELPESMALLRERPDDFYVVSVHAELLTMLARCGKSPEWARGAAQVWTDWQARGGKGQWAGRQQRAAEELARQLREK